MSWDDRQRAMLDAMGLKIWAPLPEAAEHRLPVAPGGEPIGAEAEALPARVPVRPSPTRATLGAPVLVERQAGAATASAGAGAGAGAGDAGRDNPAAPPAVSSGLPVRPASSFDEPAEASSGANSVQSLLPKALAAADGERVRAITDMDWAALRESVSGCRACGLCEGRKQTVFGVGHEQAHWMIVGEAPGEQEDLQGEPFVGPAGKLLDNMLRAVGLGRGPGEPVSQVFIANTLKCRPPRNRNPEPGELAQCLPYLQRQVALVKPRVILALGRFAVQTLLQRSDAIGRLRGQVHAYEGIPVVVSYHPAYLLRNLPDKARAWEDLCLAREVYRRSFGDGGAG